MSKKSVVCEVSESSYEIIAHTAKITAAIKAALVDGFQPGQDLPVMVTSLISELPGIIAKCPDIKSDVAEDKVAFIKGANLAAYDFVDIFIKTGKLVFEL